MRVLLSLRWADLEEAVSGLVSVVKTLGWGEGIRAMRFASARHLEAMRRGEGLYPEEGKRRIWFKLHYLKQIFAYLKDQDEDKAVACFESISMGPTLRFIRHRLPAVKHYTQDFVLHRLWQELIRKDDNIEAEVLAPQGDSVSLHVRRCFIHEVAMDVGLGPAAQKLCHGDHVFWENRHPNIRFSRTATLLTGHDHCDHTLTWVK